MIFFPNAKINIGLHITGKRPDGFHNLETVFYPVKGLTDILEFLPSQTEQEQWSFSGFPIDVPKEKNLIYTVYRYFRKNYDIPLLDVHLHKTIPMGAGLGGGSSDVAFFITGLNDFFGLSLSEETMKEIAGRFGSDCPFFIDNTPSFAEGKGEKLHSLDIDFSNYFLVIVKPGNIHINTASAYASLSHFSLLQKADFLANISTILQLPWFKNDFEPFAFSQYTVLHNLKQTMSDLGAVATQMTGSGSAIYGLFENDIDTTPLESEESFVWKGRL
jgi:4-diphosphocytidyl-2-C-methyl-D-erythritol kinase